MLLTRRRGTGSARRLTSRVAQGSHIPRLKRYRAQQMWYAEPYTGGEFSSGNGAPCHDLWVCDKVGSELGALAERDRSFSQERPEPRHHQTQAQKLGKR